MKRKGNYDGKMNLGLTRIDTTLEVRIIIDDGVDWKQKRVKMMMKRKKKMVMMMMMKVMKRKVMMMVNMKMMMMMMMIKNWIDYSYLNWIHLQYDRLGLNDEKQSLEQL